MPPSVRSVTLWRRRLSVSTWFTSESPISQGTPANLMEVCGEAPVPPTLPEMRMTSALALATPAAIVPMPERSEEHTSELQSLMRISYAVFCLKKKHKIIKHHAIHY